MSDDLERELAELAAQYRSGLAARLVKLEQLCDDLAEGRVPAERVRELHRELHSIAGSAKTFGFPAVTGAARAAETFLEPYCGAGAAPRAEDRDRLRGLLAAIERAFAEPRSGGS